MQKITLLQTHRERIMKVDNFNFNIHAIFMPHNFDIIKLVLRVQVIKIFLCIMIMEIRHKIIGFYDSLQATKVN